MELAYNLSQISNISEVFSSVLLPIPSTVVFKNLMVDKNMRDKYYNVDNLPIEELRRDFISKFCEVDYAYLTNVRDEIASYFKIFSSLGKFQEI